MTEEKLNIQITEEPEEHEQEHKIQDEHYEINTNTNEPITLTTSHITGYLESVYLETNQTQVLIRSNMHPSLVYYENNDFRGSQLLPLRIRAIAANGEGFNYSHEKIALNEPLDLVFKAPIGTTIKIMIRYKKC